ncbi:amidase family protein [Burkholderia sp. BCC1977]|uniref:amidase family protein n=1 Tax=Burkholderia sp. BCC1977 TaxID=2817440 RepID=UPI002ABE0304|nr:amidase family protein [Burkholderia sp. BCC1977]
MSEIDLETISALSTRLGLDISEADLACYQSLLGDVQSAVADFEKLPQRPAVVSPAVRDPGHVPTFEEDPLNAVIRRISIKREGARGKLSGRRIGLKDTIAVAGVPMTAASRLLEDYIPAQDAVVVDRLLDEGAELVAKLNMDGFAWSGSADTGDYGPILNPVDRARSASGSSGGSAAALYYDWVDMTLGADQAGSIRMPASWCGVLGLKPTHGLIPYTGVMSVDPTIDHVGPLTRTVADMALMLDVLAGADPSDPRQIGNPGPEQYSYEVENASSDLKGVRIGLLREGFGTAVGVIPEVARAVRETATRFEALGAELVEVSIPEHLHGGLFAFAFYCEAQLHAFESGGNGYGWNGTYTPDLAQALGNAFRNGAARMPATLKTVLLAGEMLRNRYNGALYARAQNLRPWLRMAYDRGLDGLDALILPTTPMPARVHTSEGDLAERVRRGWSTLPNTPTADVTGHPAISIPAAQVEGMPQGVMLIGKHFRDANLLRLARAYEQEYGWFPEV